MILAFVDMDSDGYFDYVKFIYSDFFDIINNIIENGIDI